MSLQIRNWKLLFLGLFFILIFIKLGFWQLSRAEEKESLLADYTKRQLAKPLSATLLNQADVRFHQAKLTGYFDNQHTFLLDNKIVNGEVGYEVFTPFIAKHFPDAILVDRGFIRAPATRTTLPKIKTAQNPATIIGLLNLPPKYFAFGKMLEQQPVIFPLRVEYINLKEIGKVLNKSMFNYILLLPQKDPAAFKVKWEIVIMDPSRHRGYALQWFAFALTLVVLSIALNFRIIR